MPRFHLGQKVMITGSVIENNRGRKGTIVSIQPNMYTEPGVTSADKYIVRFEEALQSSHSPSTPSGPPWRG